MFCIHCGHDPELARKLDHIFDALHQMEHRIMSAISDFVAKVTAFNQDVSDDLDALQAAIGNLNDTITALNNSAGTVTPADQALIDQAVAQGTALAAKADALAGKTPPAPPAP